MKKEITKDKLIGITGLIICLFSLVVVLSSKSFLAFLSIGILAAFGFIGFWILMPFLFIFGLYLIIRKKVTKLRFDISLWGILIIVLALLILCSGWGSEGQKVTINGTEYIVSMFNKSEGHISLQYNTCVTIFQQIADKNGGFVIGNNCLGGGFVGYVICGALNSAITPLGTTIVCWVLIAIGILLVLNRTIKKLYKKLKTKKNQPETISNYGYSSIEEGETTTEPVYTQQEVSQPVVKPEFSISEKEEIEPTPNIHELSVRNYNRTHSLKRPVLHLHGEEDDNDIFDIPSDNPFQKVNAPTNVEETPTVSEETTNGVPSSFPMAENPQERIEGESSSDTDPEHRPQPKAKAKPTFTCPPLSLLMYHESPDDLLKNKSSCDERVGILNTIFADLKVGAEVISYTVGPSVTRYDVKTQGSVSVNAIERIVKDISVRLGGVPSRFEPIVLGKPTSGLEIENTVRTSVGLRESMELLPKEEKFTFNIPFGKDISGNLVHASLRDFPHMLVAGATGSGKSIFMHSVLLSLIMRNTPYQLKLLLIDPKRVEMAYYHDIPHLLCPNVSDPRKALVAMKKLVTEMERRYNVFEANHVRDIKEFNRFAASAGLEPLPYIVVCVDEYADLNDECKEIREPVVRIAQKARSAGIHMIIATQRPSVNVIDGVIKANIICHVALMVASAVDSSVIIGEGGAEKLLGNGDMIIDCPQISKSNKPRVQGCFVDTPEINKVCDYLRKESQPMFDPEFMDLTDHSNDIPNGGAEIVVDTAALKEASEDQLYETIKTDIINKEYCSISFIQRTYGVGFPKAGRMFNKLIKDGYVAPTGDARGSKVLIHAPQSEGPTSVEQSTLYVDNDENSSKPEDNKVGE